MSETARRPSKVLHVMNNASGGAAISTVALMAALKDEGVASAAVCHRVGSREEREAILDATDGETIFSVLYFWNQKFRTPWQQRPAKEIKQGLRTGWARSSGRRVARHAIAVGADLLHTNTILNLEGGVAARLLGLPHVWHLRELLGAGAWFRLPIEGRRLGSFLASRCSKLVANSETAAAGISAGLPDGLLTVVPNGIDVQRFTAERASSSETVVVGMVANLSSEWKKHWLFIEAAARVDCDLPVEFRIYGADPIERDFGRTNPYTRDLRLRIERLGLGGRIHFRGFHTDPAAIMREIDILVHPCDLESFGRIVAEAMAASRPVVGVRAGAVAEVVVDGVTGLLSDPDDPAEIARHIERLAKAADLRDAMGAAGRRRVEDRYSLKAHVEQMLTVYGDSMSRPLVSSGLWRAIGGIR